MLRGDEVVHKLHAMVDRLRPPAVFIDAESTATTVVIPSLKPDDKLTLTVGFSFTTKKEDEA